MEHQIFSLIIPLATIFIAIYTKDVVVSLLGGSFFGLMALHGYDPAVAFTALFNGIVLLFSEGWIVKTIIFIMLVGSIMEILTQSGAVDEFVSYLSQKAQKIDSPKGAMMLAYIIGIIVFIESSITVMVASIVAKPLFDKNGVSREKLAYICDSTSAPVCSMLPLNGWGALLLGLITSAIAAGTVQGDAVEILIKSLFFNFYAIFTIIMVFVVIFKDINIGPMKLALPRVYNPKEYTASISDPKPYKFLLPLGVLIGSVIAGFYITGGGDIYKGSGSTSVYYAVIVTLFVSYLFFRLTGSISHKEYFEALYRGIEDMVPITIVMILAFLIGKVISDIGTAKYLASMLHGNLPSSFAPMMVFLLASLLSFATGTSWGTFSIMMPIALAFTSALGTPAPLMVAAVISGGVFGDHASPISDTTIISSMAAGCENIDHVNTQLPYALIAGGLSALAFLIAGLLA